MRITNTGHNAYPAFRYIDLYTGLGYPPYNEGRIFWDDDAKTVGVMTNVNGVTLQVGHEMYIRATNKTGATINNGQLVYVNGAQGSRPTIALAQANASATAQMIGMATHDIENNQTGFITAFGVVNELNTNGYPEGTRLYLSDTIPGAWTDTPPTAPSFPIQIGVVLFENNSEGRIQVNVGPTDVTGSMVINALDINTLFRSGDIVGGDYSEFETGTGFLEFNGAAEYWDDLQVNLAAIPLPASNAPAWRTYNFGIGGGIAYPVLGYDIGEYQFFNLQTSHRMKLSSILDSHIHWSTPTSDAGKRIKFQIDVLAAPIGGTWAVPAGSPYSAEYLLDGTENTKHMYLDIGEIPAINTTVSSVYHVRFQRVAASANDYPGEVYVIYNDSHYQGDTVGSREEKAK